MKPSLPTPHPLVTTGLTLLALLGGSLGVPTWCAADSVPGVPATQPVAATQPAATQPVGGLFGPPATQPAATAPPVPEGVRLPDGTILLNFRNASLDAVLAFLSEAGGLTVLNDVKVEGRVNVLSKQPITVAEALEVLNTILKDRGYAAIRQGKTLKIVPLESAKRATIPVRVGNDPTAIALTDEIITQVIPVRFADAMQLKRDLAPLVPTYADLSANASTNTLILTDTSAGVRRLVEIIHNLDTSVSAAATVRVFPLKYANANNAARLINEVFKQDQPTAGGAGAQRGNVPVFFGRGGQGPGGAAAGTTGTSDTSGARPQAKVTASADDRTNILVVSAPLDLMPMIEQVLKELDANPAQDQAVFTYNLRNADAVNVQNVINSLFGTATGTGTRAGTTTTGRTGTTTGTTPTGRTSSRTGTGASSGMSLGTFGSGTGATSTRTTGGTSASLPRLSGTAAQTAADLAGQVYAVADTDTNSVLVMTASTNFPRVKAILEELDRPIPQVLIKVLLAEVSHDNNTDLGVEFSAINLPNSGKSTVFTDMGIAATPSPAGGLMYKLVETNVTAAIAALQKVGKIDVLSRPYILASDNQLASIMVGQSVPFITDTRLDSNNNPVNTISYQDIGIILSVTPHINPDGVVVMDVAPEISAIDSSVTVPISSSVNATVFTKRAAQTRVAIRDGQTIVIGGLMQDRKNQTVRQVPIVGDIPVLGELFKRNTNTTNKTELLIFLTPHVAKEPDRLQKMSEDERKGAVITPQAVAPGMFEAHMKGLERGGPRPPATQPAPTVQSQP